MLSAVDFSDLVRNSLEGKVTSSAAGWSLPLLLVGHFLMVTSTSFLALSFPAAASSCRRWMQFNGVRGIFSPKGLLQQRNCKCRIAKCSWTDFRFAEKGMKVEYCMVEEICV
jgi:hypothetical protein